MFVIRKRRLGLSKCMVWFAERAIDLPDCDAAYLFATEQGPEAAEAGFRCQGTPTFLLDLTRDPDNLLAQMKKRCRYDIRQSDKSGISIKIGSHVSEFADLYRDFTEKKQLNEYLNNLAVFLEHGRLYTAWLDGIMLGGLLTIEDNRQARWLLSGSMRLRDDQAATGKRIGQANRLLVWRAALDCQDRGLETFDLGGHYEGPDPDDPQYRIAQFKRGFGGTRVVRYRCVKLYHPLYKALKFWRDTLATTTRRAAPRRSF